MNPYLNRLMIQQPDQFFGRQKELGRVLSRLAAARPQSVSLVGERRIGKSSFLWRLTQPELWEAYQPTEGRRLVIFFDFQQLRDLSPSDFFSLLVERARNAAPEITPGGAAGYPEFQRILEELGRSNLFPVFLFDEFDAVTSNPRFQSEFYSFLRSMANNYPVSYVTSSRVELQTLCHSTEIADSPFFNIFTNLHLKSFERSEALELITKPSSEAGYPLAPYADSIIGMAGYFPFFLQIACCACVDCLEENPGQPLHLQQAESRFLEEASPHFEYLLSHFSEEQLDLCETVARGDQPGAEEKHISRRLVRDGYLMEDALGQLCFASRLFAEHVTSLGASSRRSGSGARTTNVDSVIQPGMSLNQYKIARKVGEGGMGRVYEARDETLGRRVAVKVIRPELLGNTAFRKRFLQEARLAAALDHPAITAVHELTEHAGQVVLIMEWLDGKTLKQRIQEAGKIDWKQMAAWLIESAGGLEAAHRQGIVHRDIKSANLYITSANHVKILDFGLAKHLLAADPASLATQMTSAGELLGTIEYMSPEQACGEEVDHRTDLFSLGVVLFEGVTGTPPFRRSSPPATLHAIVNEPSPDLGLYDVEGAERIEPILNKLLEKNPNRRYQSAAQVAKDLKELLHRRRFFSFRRQ